MMRIGVFDSGLGGLIVLRAMLEKLPEYDFVYLGDNARTPYGNRSQEILYTFAREAMDYLFNVKQCQLVIIACNTISAKALRKLQQEYLQKNHSNKRILGVIRPLVESAAAQGSMKVGVLATRATVHSGAYISELQKLNPKIKVAQQEASLLVPLIEEGRLYDKATRIIADAYLESFRKEQIDSLILGCTHYPLLISMISELMGKDVNILDAPTIVADSLQEYLIRHPEIELKLEKRRHRDFLVTDISQHYHDVASTLFNEKVDFKKVYLA